jgi:signal transduction histidine kinase
VSIRGLKTKIAVNVAILLLVSAILTGVVVFLITQGVAVRNHIDQQERLLRALSVPVLKSQAQPSGETGSAPATLVSEFSERMSLSAVLYSDKSGKTRLYYNPQSLHDRLLRDAIQTTLQQGAPQRHYLDLDWAVIWWHAKTVIVTIPIDDNYQIIGAGGAVISLEPVFSRMLNFRLLIILYIIINSMVLTLLGLYRIFRLYLRPIDRMVRQAETYGDDDDFLFSFRREDNELNRLSKALNRMLDRIANDRRKLEESVASLATANTELKNAQAEIIRAEKMASVGRLAAGVAHEIGNPIGIVLGYLDLLKQDDLAPTERNDFLERSELEIQRINTVIGQLLDLARPRQSRPQIISIHDTIDDFTTAMDSQPMLTGIDIRTDFKADKDTIFGDADQIRQVLLNMMINAADAISESTGDAGGTISITTANEDDPQSNTTTWVVMAFHDSGAGIAPDLLPNIFDPFFTTKAPGKGTGLGLSVSYMIIKKMGGTITAQSAPDSGTTLTLKLPYTANPPG